jgi:NarL family two-component system sensor histidine kinase LiaS
LRKPFIRRFWTKGMSMLPEMKMIRYYRLFSYVLTSSFYIIWGDNRLGGRLLVVLFLGVAAFILDYIYSHYKDKTRLIELTMVFETFGNIAILIPSGGIHSPYIWYSLNAVLVSSFFLSSAFFFINLMTYSVILGFITVYMRQSPDLRSFYEYLLENSNLFLSYILIIIAVKLLVVLVRKVNREKLKTERINSELIKANKMLGESMDSIALLSQNVNAFVNIKNKERLGFIIADYVRKITKAPLSFIYTVSNGDENGFETNGEIDNAAKEILRGGIIKNLDLLMEAGALIRENIAGKDIIMAAIESSNDFYGVLGIEMDGCSGEIIENQNIDQIKMLSSLSAVLFERFKVDEMNRDLLIAEEQHRIANEIHDGVSQRLFYTLCKINNMTRRAAYDTDLIAELNTIRDSMTDAIKELRETIYSNGSDNTTFESNIRKHISEAAGLSGVNMELQIRGSFEYVGYELKNAVMRIIREACGNAIRHGKSKNLKIELSRGIDEIRLSISDDGVGFNLYEKTGSNGIGLGIRNMRSLVYSFDGCIDIYSGLLKGTAIKILLPLARRNKGDRVV